MRKIIFGLLVFLGFSISYTSAQLTVTLDNVTVSPGGQASVNVKVNGFTNLLGAQFSINYDSLIVGYNNTTNFANLGSLNSSAVSGPNGVGVKKGQITFSWFDLDGSGKSLPDGTTLFTIVFDAIGAAGSSTPVSLSNTPRKIEITNASLMPVPFTPVNGSVTIMGSGPSNPCPDPACTNNNSLIISAPDITAQNGATVCIPVTVRRFNEIQSGQGSITWTSSQLEFTEIKFPSNGGIPGLGVSNFNTTNTASGQMTFVWFNNSGTPVSLPDNTVIMELCYRVLAPTGTTACVIFGQGSLISEWTGDNGEVPTCFEYARVTVGDVPEEEVGITVASTSGNKDDIICLGVTVDNFVDIVGMTINFNFDATKLQFVRTDMYDLEGLNDQQFNITGGNLRMVWTSQNQEPLTKPDGHKIFQICFRLIGGCNETVNVSIGNPTEVVGIRNGIVVLPTNLTNGAITIMCPTQCNPVCTAGAITMPKCNGGTDGSIMMSVTNATATATCTWRNNASGAVVKTGLVSAGCNLTNVGAGTYTFEVSCEGTVSCSQTITINQPSPINVPSTNAVTNVSCGTKGSILVTPNGGTPPYSYSWTPSSLGNTNNPQNLDAGVYSVVVSDANQCAATAVPFTVGNTQTNLQVVGNQTAIACKGASTGAIQLNITGGCPNYTTTWAQAGLSGTNPTGLRAGIYTATVTDMSQPVQSRTVTVTVTEPANALAITVPNVTDATGPTNADGSITLNITGGTANYTVVWSPFLPDATTSGMLTTNNVAPNTYSVTVTDANGCTAVRTGIIVGVQNTTTVPSIGDISITSDFNGFSVACNGDATGVISATVSGTTPITATLRQGSTVVQSLQLTGPDVTFSNLRAGTYTLLFNNSVGSITSNSIVITQPTRLAVTTEVECTETNEATGSISLQTNNTGVGPYSFEWANLPDTTSAIENLVKDAYSVTITDANGCERVVTNIEVEDCEIINDCYTASSIVTPNGDNFNDFFVISCSEDFPNELSIFDRWGRVVYSQFNYQNEWQALDNDGNRLSEGGYIWVLNVNFGSGRREIYKGTVNVLY